MEFHEADGDPAALVGRLCVALLDEAGEGIPVDLEVLASFRNAHVAHVEQAQAETVHWDGKNFQIRLRNADTTGRQRFSCAHAIVHTWFLESAGHGQDGSSVEQSWSEAEEELCDLGAAALLLPETAFRATCPDQVTMDDVLRLADDFQASAEATALRAVALSPTPLAMVVLEMALKPAEQKALSARRPEPSILGFDSPKATPRLRVAKSYARGMRYLPSHKSVGDATPLASVLDNDGVDYVGEIGILEGTYRVSARNLPMKRGGQLTNRVVAIVAPHA